MEAKRNLISSLERRILFYIVALGLHASPSLCNQYMKISWWGMTVENVRVTSSTQIGCDIMLSYVMQKVLLLLWKIRDLNVNLERIIGMTSLAQRPTPQNDITGTLACFVFVGACFESWAGTPAVITLFVAFLSPFGNVMCCNLYEITTAFFPFLPH